MTSPLILQFNVLSQLLVCQKKISGTACSHPPYLTSCLFPPNRGWMISCVGKALTPNAGGETVRLKNLFVDSYPDILQEDPPSSVVLHFHQLFSMLTLLMRLITEKLGKVVQCLVITVKVVCLYGGKRVMWVHLNFFLQVKQKKQHNYVTVMFITISTTWAKPSD